MLRGPESRDRGSGPESTHETESRWYYRAGRLRGREGGGERKGRGEKELSGRQRGGVSRGITEDLSFTGGMGEGDCSGISGR